MCAKRLWGLALLIIPLLLVACGDSGGDELTDAQLAQLPTVRPSRTPTDIPTDTSTPSPTETPLPTNTSTPSNTPTATATNTPLSTNTPLATATRTVTPTNTVTPTVQFTATPLPSPTPAATLTPAGPSIQSFVASPSQVAGGATVTLVWQATGETAVIEQLDASQVVTQSYTVQPSGNISVPAPQTGPQVTYRLRVTQSGNQVTRDVIVFITTTCATPWFFSNPPAGAGCPTTAVQSVTGKFQQFQNGFMVNFVFNGVDKVYGFNTVDRAYAAYNNTWDGTSTYSDPSCGTPPNLLLEPQDVFNWMYYQQLGTLGKWCTPGTGIGWAVQNANLGANFRYQLGTPVNGVTPFYLELPNTNIIRVAGQEPIGSWEQNQ